MIANFRTHRLFATLLLMIIAAVLGLLVAIMPHGSTVADTPSVMLRLLPPTIPENAVKILCIGDSITAGAGDVRHHGGYRSKLAELLSPLPVVFVGSQRNGYEGDAGYSGFTTWALIPKAYEETSAMKPDLILLMAGTNDATGETAELALQGEKLLIETLHQQAPKSIILVASAPPMGLGYTRGDFKMLDAYNKSLPSMVAAFQAQGLNIHFVDIYHKAGILPADLFDKLHPNEAGYTKIARQWAIAIKKNTGIKLRILTGRTTVTPIDSPSFVSG